MVAKRQCSFCAGVIEPGRGLMFVKRDGAIFYFCSGTCRKHQFTYHRVSHRLKWTRAHTLKRESARGHSALPAKTAPAASKPAKPAAEKPAPKPAPKAAPAGDAPAKPATKPAPAKKTDGA